MRGCHQYKFRDTGFFARCLCQYRVITLGKLTYLNQTAEKLDKFRDISLRMIERAARADNVRIINRWRKARRLFVWYIDFSRRDFRKVGKAHAQ